MDLFKKVEWFEKLALELAGETQEEESEERQAHSQAIKTRMAKLAELTKKK